MMLQQGKGELRGGSVGEGCEPVRGRIGCTSDGGAVQCPFDAVMRAGFQPGAACFAQGDDAKMAVNDLVENDYRLAR